MVKNVFYWFIYKRQNLTDQYGNSRWRYQEGIINNKKIDKIFEIELDVEFSKTLKKDIIKREKMTILLVTQRLLKDITFVIKMTEKEGDSTEIDETLKGNWKYFQ